MNAPDSLPSLIRSSDITLATAESCTGGLISHYITNIPGSSRWFRGGVVAYHNALKNRLLGVEDKLLEQFGAVSPEVAAAMAAGICKLTGATWGISSTGIAGPTGGSDDKPVGLVFIGLAMGEASRVERFVWPYNRQGNKEASAEQALQMVVDQLTSLQQG